MSDVCHESFSGGCDARRTRNSIISRGYCVKQRGRTPDHDFTRKRVAWCLEPCWYLADYTVTCQSFIHLHLLMCCPRPLPPLDAVPKPLWITICFVLLFLFVFVFCVLFFINGVHICGILYWSLEHWKAEGQKETKRRVKCLPYDLVNLRPLFRASVSTSVNKPAAI